MEHRINKSRDRGSSLLDNTYNQEPVKASKPRLLSDDNLTDKIRSSFLEVHLSKESYEELERQLSEQLVDDWKEDLQCKVFRGIKKENYLEFLELFQKATGIDENVIKRLHVKLALVVHGKMIQKTLKSFKYDSKSDGAVITGQFGMYGAVINIDEVNLA